ncbi:hypothetical protein BZA77DRAFT_305929 [Pyronema omphalodes]|nr:hypothetical protein BZA77DRAFT_305929 [Pyronema omphalodes]
MDPQDELRQLKFTPRSNAVKHMAKFEKLIAVAYPRATDAGKWSLFVKTIDSNDPNVWKHGYTPSRWLMELNDQWIRENPPCEDPNCNDCKNDAMSFEHLRNSFLDRWATDERPARRHPAPSRSYTMPPQSIIDSGSDTESNAPTAIVPHSSVHLPPAAPTPPNEPVSEIQETKTQISINAEHGSGQIVLSISENKQKRRKRPQELGSSSPGSRSASPARYPQHHRAIEPGPASHGPVQVIEANPDPVNERALELRSPQSPDHRIPQSPDDRDGRESRGEGRLDGGMDGRMDGRMEMYKPSLDSPPTPPVEDAPQTPPMRPRLLEGKVCAITGASRGIGRAIALGFAREGAHIIAHYWGTKNDPANEEIVSLCVDIRSLGQGCTIVFGDISDPRTSENIVRRAVETYGRLDVAVGNAGMCWYRDFLEVTPDILRRHVEVNLNGNFYFVQACARQFKQQFLAMPADTPKTEYPDYSIICVSATTGGEAGGKQAHFSPTAAGIRELMRSCAQGLAKFGVRCNTLAPGIVQTKMVKEVVEDMEVRGRLEKKNPFGRLGVPSDVVGPAVWLASEMAKWTNGQEIVVDGGTSIG